jgi:hypothetical protein
VLVAVKAGPTSAYLVALMMEAIGSSETPFLTRATRVLQLLVTAKVLNSRILVTLISEAIHSSESSDLTGATRHHIPQGIVTAVKISHVTNYKFFYYIRD